MAKIPSPKKDHDALIGSGENPAVVTAEKTVVSLSEKEIDVSDAAGIERRAMPTTNNKRKIKKTGKTPNRCQYRRARNMCDKDKRKLLITVSVSERDTIKHHRYFRH